MTLDEYGALALSLPGVEEGMAYGTPIWRVGKKMLTRMWDEETVVLKVDFSDREALLANQPDVFFLTDHHRGHALVTARLANLAADQAESILSAAWRSVAPKRLLRI